MINVEGFRIKRKNAFYEQFFAIACDIVDITLSATNEIDILGDNKNVALRPVAATKPAKSARHLRPQVLS